FEVCLLAMVSTILAAHYTPRRFLAQMVYKPVYHLCLPHIGCCFVPDPSDYGSAASLEPL
ncbi:unnamed protein product, partial [marine sediment metagenome]